MPFPVFLITGRPQRGAQAPTLCDANAGRRGIVPPEAPRGDHKPDSGGYSVEHLPGGRGTRVPAAGATGGLSGIVAT